MKKLLFSLLCCAAVTLTGCSPFTLVNSEVYNNADLTNYKTFRIVEPDSIRHLPFPRPFAPTVQTLTTQNPQAGAYQW